jgi:predicted signal transduction protein with EAL and GGDEF domain
VLDSLHFAALCEMPQFVLVDVRMLRRLGVDYYQGFYFAKPMPRDEFVAFVSNNAS